MKCAELQENELSRIKAQQQRSISDTKVVEKTINKPSTVSREAAIDVPDQHEEPSKIQEKDSSHVTFKVLREAPSKPKQSVKNEEVSVKVEKKVETIIEKKIQQGTPKQVPTVLDIGKKGLFFHFNGIIFSLS